MYGYSIYLYCTVGHFSEDGGQKARSGLKNAEMHPHMLSVDKIWFTLPPSLPVA